VDLYDFAQSAFSTTVDAQGMVLQLFRRQKRLCPA